jgi:hypothetical protein
MLAVLGPGTALSCAREPDLLFAALVMGAWSIVALYYTIEWTLRTLRSR